jgi:arginase
MSNMYRKMKPIAILEAPSILGLKPTGVEDLPDALLAAGLANRLDARRAGRVEPWASYRADLDRETRMLNPQAIAAYSRELADAVGGVLDRGEFPLVLGGDCSILLGDLLALHRRGRFGLLFLDGHADFYNAEANPNGEAASMDLALATGRGPEVVTNIEGRRPLVRDEDVVVFGFRDAEEQAEYGSQPLPPGIRAIDLAEIHRRGIRDTVSDAIGHLTRRGAPESFWIHLDADVLDDAIMPAVDYRIPGGLSWDELVATLRTAMESGRAVGLEVTIYNPKLDADGSSGRGLADTLATVLAAPVAAQKQR